MSKGLATEMKEDIWALVDMPFELFKTLKTEEMKLLSVKDKSIDYTTSKDWKEANKTLKEAIIHRRELEEEMRAKMLVEQESK